ncbi:uncharacterized protein LOC109855333 isoform X2 [Pseudomyrmex gracilis]|uniref:uncharacterized protein LOC109855333 isoform X2 n=1 Tax=Pseudomyrmex gracilis TaxID=219809 RepID=UPI000995264C|nr:uncharacterized protein LOC109855333 isoform X2 [Pseudomyrmex gracilis]
MEIMQKDDGRRMQEKTDVAARRASSRFALAGNDDEKLTRSVKTPEMDPYKELELYLAKVNEEIGEIIESAAVTPLCVAEERPTSIEKSRDYEDEELLFTLKPLITKSRLAKRRNSLKRSGEDIIEWSNNILAEFNGIIANEIDKLTKDKRRKRTGRNDSQVVQYKELLNEFGLSDSESSSDQTSDYDSRDEDSIRDRRYGIVFADDTCCYLLNSNYNRIILEGRKSGSLPENLQDIIGKRDRFPVTDASGSDYDEPCDCLPTNSIGKQITVSLPSELEREWKDARFNSCRVPKIPVELSLQISEENDIDSLENGLFRSAKDDSKEPSAKLLPPQRCDEEKSLCIDLTNQRQLRRGSQDQEIGDDLDDDVFPNEKNKRSRSLENYEPKSVALTEEKKLSLSKLLKKRHAPMFHWSCSSINLANVFSNQNLLRLRNNKIHETKNDKTMTKKRAISPLNLCCDITAKRLTNRQINSMDLRKFSPSSNDVAVSCDLSEDNNDNDNDNVENCDNENVTLGKLECTVVRRFTDEPSAGTELVPILPQCLLSRIQNSSDSNCVISNLPMNSTMCFDVATQTSPAISRSSSFTWVSDCDSPQVIFEPSALDSVSQDTVDYSTCSLSSQDLLQSMDEISSRSLSSDSTDRASPLESGIGTASPPRSTDRRLNKLAVNKYHRKETWERIRRQSSKMRLRSDKHSQDVWIKRENTHAQTNNNNSDRYLLHADSSSSLDDSFPKIETSQEAEYTFQSEELCCFRAAADIYLREVLEDSCIIQDATHVERYGNIIPPCIQQAINWLLENGLEYEGIFRKNGLKSRITSLRLQMESDATITFDDVTAYDVADIIKEYFREIPGGLVPENISKYLIAAFTGNVEPKLDITQCALILLPDEHREALKVLLDLLVQVASKAEFNKMTKKNLATCLSLTVFHIKQGPAFPSSRKKKENKYKEQEDKFIVAANKCLTSLVEWQERYLLFKMR